MKLGKSYLSFVLAVGFVLSGNWKESRARQVKLGVLLPWSGSWPLAQRMAEVIPRTIEDINRNKSLLGNNNLTFVWRDTRNQASQGLWAMVDLWKNENLLVDAFIGPVFSVICEPCGLLAERLNLPMISWGCSSQRLSNKNLYPTFARTKTYGRTNLLNTSRAMASVLRHFKWKRVSLFHSSESVWTDLALKMNSELERSDIKANKLMFSPFLPQTYDCLLKDAREKARVFILLCYMKQVKQIIMAAKNLNMTNGDYVFVTSDFTMDTTHSNLSALEYYHAHSDVLDGIIDVSVNLADNVEFQLNAQAIERAMQTPGSAFYSNETRVHEVSHFFAYAADAITLYALALNDTLAQGGNITDGRHIAKNMFGKTFNGLSGVVSIDDNGDRIPFYELRNLNNNSFIKIASILTSGLQVVEDRKVVWFGGQKEVPLDEPVCGFNNEHCDDSSKLDKKLWIAIPIVSLVLVLAMIVILLSYKRRNKIRSLSSVLIRYEDIDMIGCIGTDNKGTSSIMHSLVDFSTRSDRSSLHVPSESYAFIGRYKNRQVYVRKLALQNLNLNHQIVKELFQVQRILHVNINPILGVCMTTPNMCIVSEACSRGSLLDILSNEDIKLDLTFKMSFATDIASGMKALHASDIRYHGSLTSSNCLIDRTWGCRIGDYGLRHLRTQEKKFEGNYASPEYKVILWTAPEHILERKQGFFTGSQAGDVYSYGIILNEVFTRKEPFAQLRTLVSIQEIVRRILSSEKPNCLRPPTNNDICEKLIHRCWEGDPSTRPQFSSIKNTLRKLNGGRSHRLVDTMLRKMEIYSNNLEELVEERTRQLEAEKARTDELLFEMLPRPVAEQLKAGKSVQAECFDQVTVFFSDIVGFTQLASSSTAFEVVTFLNDLYTYFDNIIHHYDVYKVETIGDAYMVVSGLPERNLDRHAGQIATMALHLLCDIRLFKIRHRPDTHPEMRIGIHSGPCVAGVVGVKKPRYDIFGDTVNVASRMESNGVPNRIHISKECRQVLMNLGGYHIERRGEIELKGKGRVITYFLNGKDNFNKTRPDHLELLLSSGKTFGECGRKG
ncbi:guanylate cyclase 32E-like [Actinia tenebrosa]|uniref:Guanylate cyclase n=1 Tax=Actinia tenebrosa TaxID=6105 RepID=A0A6P8HFI3_ACTTE|nr:guanylate cyclase 32E-like [Actinia tenebrosa]